MDAATFHPPPFPDPAVAAAFEAHPAPIRADLLRFRALIYEAAAAEGLTLTETLKWGEPAYRPARGGTTVRINAPRSAPDRAALFFHCRTSLVETFRQIFPDLFDFSGNRAVIPRAGTPDAAIRRCAAIAFTYGVAL